MVIKFYFMAEVNKFRMPKTVCVTKFSLDLSSYQTQVSTGHILENFESKNYRWSSLDQKK